MSQKHIDSFLKLGYFIDYDIDRCPIDFTNIDKRTYSSVPREELVQAGIEHLRKSFSSLFEGSHDHAVPLSGGLDSRLILCALLEHTEAERINTYTFGVPGAYDYEIGCQVAREVGTRHSSIAMDAVSWHEDELIEIAEREDCQAVLFYSQPLRQIERLFAGCLFWSGYVGDAVAGSHLHDPPSATIEEAKRSYLRRRGFVSSVKLWRGCDEDLLPHVAGGRLLPEKVTWDEQVLFDEGVAKFTVAHVLWKGFQYKTPLINTPWMDFMFSVPNHYRFGQKLMIDIGRTAYPGYFDLPSKNRLGHGFNTPDILVKGTFWSNRLRKLAHQFVPSVNYPPLQYNDFNESLRNDPSLRRVVRSNIEDLRRRGICDWIDFDGIWRRHDWRIRNHGDALIVLASLELVLKAREAGTSG